MLRDYEGVIVNEDDWRTRVAVLETKHEHISSKIDEMSVKLDEVHSALIGARGVKWFLIAGATAFGFLVGTMKDVGGLFK